MTKYRKKPVVVEATQWHKNGDHPLDYSKSHDGLENGEFRQFSPEVRRANGWEGDIVRYYRNPFDRGDRLCEHCGKTMHEHGWIETKEGGHIVCPGDWIITGAQGEHYPCKPTIFAATYEPVTAAPNTGQAPSDEEIIADMEARGWKYMDEEERTDIIQSFRVLFARYGQAPAASACVGCEGKPAPENDPCAVCGKPAASAEPVAWRWKWEGYPWTYSDDPKPSPPMKGMIREPLYAAPVAAQAPSAKLVESVETISPPGSQVVVTQLHLTEEGREMCSPRKRG